MIYHYSAAFFAAATAAFCVILVFHPAYRNRLVRLLGLCGIAIAGSLRAMTMLLDNDTLGGIGYILWASLFLFFLSHFCSFLNRLKVRHTEGWYSETQLMSREQADKERNGPVS